MGTADIDELRHELKEVKANVAASRERLRRSAAVIEAQRRRLREIANAYARLAGR
jgi:hypothetical protein